jgi:hypothetical protein
MIDITIDDLFNKWLGMLRENQAIRYTHSDRPALVEELVSMLHIHNIDYQEAKFLKKKVVSALTTEEGRKGNGRYKGWVQAVETDYDAILANIYIDQGNIEEAQKNKLKLHTKKDGEIEPSVFYLPDNKIIEAWCRHKYGKDVRKSIIREAHRIGSSLNQSFQCEVFDTEIGKSIENYPDWLKKACDVVF